MKKLAIFAALAGAVIAMTPAASADALGGKEPWSFTEQNRAAIAIAIKGIEDPVSAGAGTIVCGGTSGGSGEGATGSGSSATANSSCIIVNNSNGAVIGTDQNSHGDQDADSETNANNTNSKSKSKSVGSIDDVAAILGGHKQGL